VGDIRHNYADVSKIKEKLGFESKVSFEMGIKNFTDWVKQQPITNNRYEKSLSEMAQKGLFK
jgi:dTDP-L-rhamnose 4-epimerase